MPDKNQQIRELKEHNDELENYFRNTIIPQLFVDGALKLQKFTPPAMKQFNLSAGDVGRSINYIKDNFRFHSILAISNRLSKAMKFWKKKSRLLTCAGTR